MDDPIATNSNDATEIDFPKWLATRLIQLKTDEAVFCPYIMSILEGDEDQDEMVEALDEILGGLGGNGINAETLRDEILSKWTIYINQKKNTSSLGASAENDQLKEMFSRIATESSECSFSKKTETDPKLRAAILSTIAQGSDSEEGEDGASCSHRKTKQVHDTDLSADFGRNTNAEKVLNEQRELKEKSKAESAKKKERDKEDRAKQKAAVQERKDKAKKKATKVERKR